MLTTIYLLGSYIQLQQKLLTGDSYGIVNVGIACSVENAIQSIYDGIFKYSIN